MKYVGYPLVNIQKAMENGPVEIVDFPSYKMVDLSIAMLVHQRVPVSKKNHQQIWWKFMKYDERRLW